MRLKPKLFTNSIALWARFYLPKIKAFLETAFTTRQEMLDSWQKLMYTLKAPMEKLDNCSPKDSPSFVNTLSIAEEALTNREIRQAFLTAQVPPVDSFGNPVLLAQMYTTFFFLLRNTYRGMRGITSFEEYKATHYFTLNLAADQAFGAGTIQNPADLRNLLPLIEEIERELEQFPASGELEHRISKD